MAKVDIEVAYALPDTQRIFSLCVADGTTIGSAIQQSGVLQEFPEINLSKLKVGVFSKTRALTDIVKAGERIEIYRSLMIDPKERRRSRGK